MVRRIAGLLLAAILALCTGELFSRVYAYLPRSLDPEFGYVASGGTRWHREGHASGHWDARGVRRSSHEGQPETSRILVTGDSFTEGVHVDDSEVYTDVAERLLRDRGHAVRVLNAGIAGSTLPYYVSLGPAYLRAFTPAWSVVQVTEDDLLGSAFLRMGTHFRRAADGTLELHVIPPEGRGGPTRRLLRHLRANSALLQNVTLQYQAFKQVAAQFRPFRQPEARESQPPVSPDSFPIAAELKLLARAYEGRVTLLFLSGAFEEATTQPTAAEAAIAEACRQVRMSCVFTRHAYAELEKKRLFPTGFPNNKPRRGHLNPMGHRAVAEALVAELLKGPARAFL